MLEDSVFFFAYDSVSHFYFPFLLFADIFKPLRILRGKLFPNKQIGEFLLILVTSAPL